MGDQGNAKNEPAAPGKKPNAALKAALSAADVTYETLAWSVRAAAAQAGVALRTNRSNVWHWVSGTAPSARTIPYIVEAVSRLLERPVSAEELGFASAISAAVIDWDADTLTALNELGRLDLDLERRTALSVAAYSVVGLAVPSSAWWAERANGAAQRPATGRRVGDRDLDAVRDMVAAFSRIDQKRGGGHARMALVQYLTADVAAYLNGRFSDDRVRRGMFSAAGELAYLSGWMAFDSGQHSVAQRYFGLAVTLAAEADDAPLAGHILRAMAHQAVDLRHPRQALNLANASIDGRRYTEASSRERSLLGVVHARALAAAGQPRAAIQALLRAEDDLASAAEGDDEPGRVFFFKEASLAHETACALRDSGDLAGARREFRRSVRTREATAFTRTHAVTLGYLGAVQARQGAIEEACGTWARALDVMDGVQSARARQTVLDMRHALSPMRHRGIAPVIELDRRAATYLAEAA